MLSAWRAARDAGPGRTTAILDAARVSLGAERASLWLRRGADRLVCADLAPATGPAPTAAVDAAWTAALDDVRARRSDDGAIHPIRLALGAGAGAVLDAPVRDDVGLAGVLCFERRAAARPFDTADAAIAAGIADRVAVQLVAERGLDLSHRDRRLHEAQRLQALGCLTTGVAHDFNNALTAILGGVQLVSMGVDDAELQATALRTIDSIGFAADLARQLLEFGRGDANGARLDVVVDDVVLRIAQLLKTLLGDARLLELRLTSAPATVRAAPTRLGQVVLNLVSNARDALPDGGRVEVETRAEADQVVLRVADDGIGIPPEVRSRIFEPLFTTKPIGQGCGLGLATVRHVVDELGGSIAVDSTPGRGTTFEIRFPRSS